MNQYVFAPADEARIVYVLRECIEYIGRDQHGNGSNYAKGRRYLREKTKCTGASIKYLYKPALKIIRNDFLNNGISVYKYHKEYCAIILEEIIKYIDSRPQIKNKVFHAYRKPIKYIDVLYEYQRARLVITVNDNYSNQAEDGGKILQSIDEIDLILKDWEENVETY